MVSIGFTAHGPVSIVTFVILLIVGLVILYWVIRTAVREGILAAWRIRNRAEKEARDDKAQGW
jgi:protein-S-isoprenylcysteine O-methyltransferase Ste14